MWNLIVTLVGVVVATTGGLLFFSNRKPGNNRQADVVAVGLLAGGMALFVFSLVYLNQRNTLESTLAADQRAATASERKHAHAKPAVQLPYSLIAVLTWGTPSDQDKATSAAIASYSSALLQQLSQLVKVFASRATIESVALTRREYEQLRNGSLAASDWCNRTHAGMVVVLGVGTSRENGQFTLWREPLYIATDCQTGRTATRIGHVSERIGDVFPYQLGLEKGMTKLLSEFARNETPAANTPQPPPLPHPVKAAPRSETDPATAAPGTTP